MTLVVEVAQNWQTQNYNPYLPVIMQKPVVVRIVPVFVILWEFHSGYNQYICLVFPINSE